MLSVVHMKLGVKQCISCLSTCIFLDAVKYPITEDQLHNGPPHPSNDAYAYAKRFIDIQNRAYNEQYGLNYFCIIPCNIYGRHDNFSLKNGHVLPALIHRCYLAKKDKQPFLVKGTGKPLRQFIHNEDLGQIYNEDIDSYNGTDNIIISSNPEDEVSIRDVALEIARNFDYEDHIQFDDSFADGQYKKTVSNKRLAGVLGKLKFTNINMGIKDTVQWFVQNYDKARK